LKLELEQAKAKCIETENTAEDVRNHAKTVSDELRSLKTLQDEQISTIEDLVDSLAQTESDAQALRENASKLEASIADYKAEIQKKDKIRQNLENQVKQNDSRIAQLFADLQTAEKSVGEMKIQLANANKKAADAESLSEKMTTDLSLKECAIQQHRDDLTNVQAEVAKLITKHSDETTILSSTIFDLRNALATASSDVERLTSRLQAVEDERLSLQQELGRKEADLLDKAKILDEERKVKLVVEADLRTHVSKIQELEKVLGYFKFSKETDEATISRLRDSFMKLRQSQLQIFGEFEQEV
jgi:DNA repair exonuclease SbcCD ATPase subunit